MKIAVFCYHKNIRNLYPEEWIEQCKNSILNQTYNEFTIFEQNYGGTEERIFENSEYESKAFPTFVHAMNCLLDLIFSLGYDYALNVNLDDWYSLDRVEKQLEFMHKGFDIISSNFFLVENEKIVHTHSFEKVDIKKELDRNNNVICHPCVAFKKAFWEENRYVPEEIPVEDMLLWKRAINNGYSFVILEDVLCFHRLHSNSVCSSDNR